MLTFSDYLLSAISVGKVKRVFSLVLPEVRRRVYGRHCSPNASLIGFSACWAGGGYGQGMGNVSKCSLGLCIFNLRKKIVGFWRLIYSWRRFWGSCLFPRILNLKSCGSSRFNSYTLCLLLIIGFVSLVVKGKFSKTSNIPTILFPWL